MNDFNESISTPRADAEGGMSALAKRAERFYRIDQIRHDKTRQRTCERAFLSLDAPSPERSDGGRGFRRLLRDLDRAWDTYERELRFAAALESLARHPALQRTLTAIRQHRKRARIVAKLGISLDAYEKRFERICKHLGVEL